MAGDQSVALQIPQCLCEHALGDVADHYSENDASHDRAPTRWKTAALGMHALLLATCDSSTGGPTSAKNLLARSRSGTTQCAAPNCVKSAA